MLTNIDNAINAVSGILYKPYVVPLILMLAGIYFTVRLKLEAEFVVNGFLGL